MAGKDFEWEQKTLERAKDRVTAMHSRMKTLEYPYHRAITDSEWGSASARKRRKKSHPRELWKIVVEKEPELLRDKNGELTSIDAWVRVYRMDGREVKVDPHRVMNNPPVGDSDPAEFFLRNVQESILQAPNPRGWNTKGTVSQFFPPADTPTTISSTNATYSTARTGGTLSAFAIVSVGVGQTTGFVIREGFLRFVTGATIPDADIVSAVTFEMAVDTDQSATDFTCNVREKIWTPAPLSTADWVSGAALSGTLLASRSTAGMTAYPGYTAWTSQAAFLTTANLKTGTVELMLCSSRHEAGTTPTGNEYIQADMDSVVPRLTVTHNGAGSFPPVLQRNTPRIWRL